MTPTQSRLLCALARLELARDGAEPLRRVGELKIEVAEALRDVEAENAAQDAAAAAALEELARITGGADCSTPLTGVVCATPTTEGDR